MKQIVTGRRPASAPGVEPAPSATMVIFGAGGDLTARLLVPALYNLMGEGLLADDFEVLGIDIADQSENDWHAGLTQTMEGFAKDPDAEFHPGSIDEAHWQALLTRMRYLQGDFGDAALFDTIGARLGDRSAIFYMAVPARFFATLAQSIGRAGLLQAPTGEFRRLVVEKPFGSDLATAKALNATLLSVAREDQIFRTDHFLGKEPVQSIMTMRFGNAMFEPFWNRRYVSHVEITAAETLGVEGRASFYEPTGAMRDMVPNHLFQLLTMTAMDAPTSLAPEAIRTEKTRLLESVVPLAGGDVVRGQYGEGEIAGHACPAYTAEPGVASESRTETYFAAKLSIENERWSGVPFYLRTGKRLMARRTEIIVHLAPPAGGLWGVQGVRPGSIALTIDPEQKIGVTFNVKKPGPNLEAALATAELDYDERFEEEPNVGYESLLYDVLTGDPVLFQRADAIEASWTIVDGILAAEGAAAPSPQIYASGSDGPDGADSLLARDGRAWTPLRPAT